MRVVSSSSLLFTSLVASSVSLPSLAAPVRARRDSVYELQEMGSPIAFESSASTSNLVGLVAPPTTPVFESRNSMLGGAAGDFKHEFEGIINALEVSASPVPVPTRSKKPFPSSLSKLSQSTALSPSGAASSSAASSTSAGASSSIIARGDSFFEGLIGALDVTSSSAASSTSSSASATASAGGASPSIIPRGDSFFEGLIGALSAPAPPSSTSAPPLPPRKTPALPSTSLVPPSESSSALSTPTLPPQPTNTPALLARSLGARNMVDELIGALEVSASSHTTPAPTSTSASATASGVPSTASVQSVLARNGYSGGMLEGLTGRGYYNASMTAASASAFASPTPSLDARGGDDILGELIGALGVLGGHAHSESATSSQTTSSPALPMTSPTLGTRDGMLDGLIGALNVGSTTTAKVSGLGIMSETSSSASATGPPTQTTVA